MKIFCVGLQIYLEVTSQYKSYFCYFVKAGIRLKTLHDLWLFVTNVATVEITACCH